MVNRPIVAHLRPPTTELARVATTRSVLAPSHQRCSSVQVLPTLDASGGGDERVHPGTFRLRVTSLTAE